MNFVEKIIAAGFVNQGRGLPPFWTPPYDPKSGWLGVDTNHPDAWFIKPGEDKELVISLQGILTPQSGKTRESRIRILFQNRAVKYIRLKSNGKVLYETFSGVIPPDEIVERFLS